MKTKNILNKIGLFTIPLIGGWAGAFGGADKGSKAMRRWLIPGLITSYAFSNTESVFVITIMSMIGALSLGYGIPNPSVSNDEGSAIGRFFYKLFKGNRFLANIFTRGLIGVIISCSLISIPIIKQNWLSYILGCLAICMINGFISWQNFGSYIFFKKELSWVETIVWGGITLCSCLIIYL